TVTYNGNGNTAGSAPTATTYASGATATVSGAGSLTKTGNIFAGWNTAANGSGTAYAAGATFTISTPVNLYAQWTTVYGVSYSGNGNTGGTVPVDSGAYATGATVTVLGNTGSLAKTGYTFGGWNTTADGSGASYAGGATFAMGSANVTLYAKWTINTYTVSFNSNSGSSVADQSVQYGSFATAPATPTKTNSTFAGWYGDAGLTSAFIFATTPITGPTTIYAKWTANLMTVTGPTSAAAGTPFDVTVTLTGPGSVTLSVSSGCVMIPPGPLTVPVSGNSVTFSVTIAPTNPTSDQTCSLSVSAPNYPDATLAALKVYKGALLCGEYDSINGPLDSSYDPDLASTVPGLGSSYVGTPGWGLRRGPNRDGAACVRVNYSCDLNAATNIATCSWDKNVVPAQQATFKYLFLWTPKPPDANGWTSYRPQVSWPPAVPDNTFTWPNWAPLVNCVSDIFSTPPTLILPTIPNAAPFTDSGNTLAQYQPNALAYVCGAQQGMTSVGAPGTSPGNGVPLIQVWDIIIDEADLKVAGP
ncbi:MAG: InlB B-repeat-containing protein, partial [Betaproteobacteria bacterium]